MNTSLPNLISIFFLVINHILMNISGLVTFDFWVINNIFRSFSILSSFPEWKDCFLLEFEDQLSVWMSMDECVNECRLDLLGWHGMNISRHTLTLIYFMNSNLIVEPARKWSHKIHTHLHISWKQKQNKHTHTYKQNQQQQKHKQPLLTHPPLPPHKLIPIQKKSAHLESTNMELN